MKWTLWATEKQRANPKPMVRCTSSASVVDTDIEEALTPIFVFFFIVVIRLWWFRQTESLYFYWSSIRWAGILGRVLRVGSLGQVTFLLSFFF